MAAWHGTNTTLDTLPYGTDLISYLRRPVGYLLFQTFILATLNVMRLNLGFIETILLVVKIKQAYEYVMFNKLGRHRNIGDWKYFTIMKQASL